jgi:hypothetical protein
MLGINIDVGWQHTASGDWTSYAADVSRRTVQKINEVTR